MHRPRLDATVRRLLWLPCVALTWAAPLAAQERSRELELLATETYVHAPAVIERIITTPRTNISFTQPNADRSWFLRTTGKDRGEIQQYGKPHLYLGGLAVDTKANRNRSLTTSTDLGLVLVNPRTGASKTLETPKGASISSPVWSPAGTQVAYIANFEDGSYAFVAEVASGRSVQVARTPLLATLVTTLEWTRDGKSLVAVVVPEQRGPAPTHGAAGVEDGPQVRLSESKKLPQRIYYSLLEDPHDKALLKYYTTGQLVLIDAKSKRARSIGAPAMFRSVDAAPDGQAFIVSKLAEPFSYRVQYTNFGSVEELWDGTGRVVAELSKTALREETGGDDDDAPGGGARAGASTPGRRNVQWHPLGPGLVYLESVLGEAPPEPQRGADARTKPTSVKLVGWAPPYGPGDARTLYTGSPEMTGATFGSDGKTLFVSDSGTVIAVRLDDPSQRRRLGRGVAVDLGARRGGGGGRAADSVDTDGALQTRMGPNGTRVVLVATDGRTVLLSGNRAPRASWMSQAPRPWADKLDLETGRRERIFDSPADAYETFVTPLDDDFSAYIYTRETPTVIRDAHLRDTRSGSSKQLTHAVVAAPEVSGAQRRRFQVTRPRDGVKFWVDVTLPADYREGTRLPTVVWFYPREYTSEREYDRSRYETNINAFPDLAPARPASSMKLWVTQGYALVEPDIPILGDAGQMNDNYVRDLRENLDAVVDAIVDMGIADRSRIGAGGHSYGAFSTVNALTLTNFFKAGIAGDGMYNRSLTPFGFQSERRTFFEAQDTYLAMSPFFRADKISGALMMYHSIEDQNTGTALISSQRMFMALQGLGKPAALFMYPYEDHSVAAVQTDLDQWARWVAWFDLYVKSSGAAARATTDNGL